MYSRKSILYRKEKTEKIFREFPKKQTNTQKQTLGITKIL